MPDEFETYEPTPDQLRDLAVKRVKAKRDLQGHLLAYVSVNLFLVGIWFITGAGTFWSVFVILGWGIGVVMNIWDVYAPAASEDRIAKEMEKLRR